MNDEFRDDVWLAERLKLLCSMHFADVPGGYPVTVRFGSRARYRFGSICARHGAAVILINGLFAHPEVPVYVVDATLAHEMAHYAHGFGSGLPKMHRHAHRGGVVDAELAARGLGEVTVRADQWRAAHWEETHARLTVDISAKRLVRAEGQDRLWDLWLCRPGFRTEEDLRRSLLRTADALGVSGSLFTVEWLKASTRQTGLSYWFRHESALRVHGLLADPRVPESVVDFEIAYWLARFSVGRDWRRVEEALALAGLGDPMRAALRWRRAAWTQFRRRNDPLAVNR